MILWYIFSLSIIVSTNSYAQDDEEVNFCKPPRNLTFETCEENSILVNAVEDCVKKKKKVAAKRGLIGLVAMNATDKTLDKKQKLKMDASSKSNSISIASIDDMIADIENGILDLEAYFDEMVYPEDADSDSPDSFAGLDLDVLATQPCWYNAFEKTDNALTEMEDDLLKLRDARNKLAALKGQVDADSERMGAVEGAIDPILNTEPIKIEKHQPVREKQKESDISGTESLKN